MSPCGRDVVQHERRRPSGRGACGADRGTACTAGEGGGGAAVGTAWCLGLCLPGGVGDSSGARRGAAATETGKTARGVHSTAAHEMH